TYLLRSPELIDVVAFWTIYPAILVITLTNLFNIFSRISGKGSNNFQKFNGTTTVLNFIAILGLLFGNIVAPSGPWDDYSFGYFVLLSFFILYLFVNSIKKTKDPLVVLITTPMLFIALVASFLVFLIDLLFPPKIQELVPYIDALRTLILNIANSMADPQRLIAEHALESLGNVSETVSDIGEGYALRKGLGQGIDFGLTGIVIALGVFTWALDLGIPPGVLFLLFGSLGLALATFSGLFGPFYGLAGAAKDFSLYHGNYRGAAFFKIIEEIFAIPFMAASAGFLLLDLPPVDTQTLEEFRSDMQDQLIDISDNINSLLGKDASAVPRKTRKMIASLMTRTTQSLNKLDFRNVREETAREFALTYYQHEFSLRPWKRKQAVEEFATTNHFDKETGEQTLKLIGYKIDAGQMDDDMVSNIMISSAMRGVIMMEQKYQSMLDSVELGQTCTGLAFGARQFLKDHYVVRNNKQKFLILINNLTLGIIAIPAVLIIGFHKYANGIFNVLGESIINQDIRFLANMRYNEISNEVRNIPSKLKSRKEKTPKSKEEKDEIKQQRNWEIRRKITTIFSKLLVVIIFPFKIIIGIFAWIFRRLRKHETNPRQAFEEAVAHAALVSMYNELYKKLVIQDHVFTTY
ncbi:MAG: hypothetical protein ACC656_00960, partial [Candidatus Heimdallarchaeota archaeon]